MVERVSNILLVTKMTKKLRPLCILLLQMSGYRRDFDETKYMSSLRKDNELLEKYNEKFQGKSQQ